MTNSTPPAVLARLIADIDATETVPVNAHPECNYFCKLVDIDTWNELRDTIRASLAQQGEAVACYRAHWPGGDVGAWTTGKPSPQAIAYCESFGLRLEYAYTHPAAVAVDEAMVARAVKAFSDAASAHFAKPYGDPAGEPFAHVTMRAALTAALQPAATSDGEKA